MTKIVVARAVNQRNDRPAPAPPPPPPPFSPSCPATRQVYLYDDRGSELFEDITRTPEYYLTNKESELLATHGEQIATFPDEEGGAARSFDSVLVELGAGSGKKMRALLDASEEIHGRACGTRCTYVPIDYSGWVEVVDRAPRFSPDSSRAHPPPRPPAPPYTPHHLTAARSKKTRPCTTTLSLAQST